MEPIWSQGLKLEAISVSIRCVGKTGLEGSQRERHCLERLRKDADEIVLVDLYFVGLRCGTIIVAKIRRNFCQYRMLWERPDRRESEEKALPEELLSV